MRIALALYQPDIAQNTGTLLRLGACLDIPVHVIHPTGFPFSRASLRRAGMDYLEHVELREHAGFDDFSAWCTQTGRRLALLSTKASLSAYDASYRPGDVLMVGRESAGVPAGVAARADLSVRIPMRQEVRSLNVAIAAGLVLGEAMRQTTAFGTLS